MIRTVKLRSINTVLLIAIVIINGYIIALPFLPGVLFWAERHTGNEVASLQRKVVATTPAETVPQDDRLVIPGMILDEPVHTGPTARTLRQGLWLRPQGSTPDKGSNTIIVGHRFTYTNPRGSFYHLDKVQLGDTIGLFWHGKKYTYTVREIKTVKASEISVEAPSETPRLTLYTCTPLWLPKDRLVIVAEGNAL